MDSGERRDRLIRHLRRGGAARIEDLARVLQVSGRTVLRDIGVLRERGFVIETQAGRGGGVRLDPASLQLTPRLTANEVFALLISVAVLRASGSLPFGGLADAGLAKIERALPRERIRDLREILERLYVGPAAIERLRATLGPPHPDLLAVFERGFLERRRMAFDYVDRKDRRSEREVEPQALLVLPPVWYIVGYDPARQDFRQFRMDRIDRPRLLDGTGFRRRAVQFEGAFKAVAPGAAGRLV